MCSEVLKGSVAAQVKAVNGKPIRNLGELVAEVDGTAADYLRLDLEYNQVGLPPCGCPWSPLTELFVCGSTSSNSASDIPMSARGVWLVYLRRICIHVQNTHIYMCVCETYI